MPSPKKANLGRRTRKANGKRQKLEPPQESREGFLYNPDLFYRSWSQIGELGVQCTYCKAKKWKEETATFCCNNGAICLPPLPKLPCILEQLLKENDAVSKGFQSRLRLYNNMFAMTSIGCQEIREGYMPTVRIVGKMYHRIGSLLPETDRKPQYLQIYFIGESDEEVRVRQGNSLNTNIDVVKSIQTILYTHNKYIRQFKTIYEKMNSIQEVENVQIIIKDHKIKDVHKGRTNIPEANEIAVVLCGEQHNKRDIVIEARSGSLQRINETHPSYDPLQYPLMFPHGSDGYSIELKQKDGKTALSAMKYYKYQFMIRDDNYLLLFRELLNLFAVDMFAKIESERALYIRLNQAQLRSEEYVNLQDAFHNDSIENIGKLVVLPSSFVGSPRYMHEKSQDGLIYVRKYGTADLFITFTCNPQWEEITQSLYSNQRSSDRYDVITRVFKLKIAKFMNLLYKKCIFGAVKCHMYTIEWQKRGLPHAHILLWLEDKIKPDEVDSVISAELPNPQKFPHLFNIVRKHMVHGPCGNANHKSPCMQDNSCSKRYPRKFVQETIHDHDGYPLYRRRSPLNGGFTTEINSYTIDNSWIVPYNPTLLHCFDAHINVEYCHSVKAIKYICKYICKGNDLTTLSLQFNEVERYISGRYISTCEAFWRIFGFDIHDHAPAIIHLAVHLENGQRIYFTQQNVRNKIINPPNTTLTAFFQLCAKDDFAKTLLYEEVPSYYTWHTTRRTFEKRKRGTIVEGYPGYYKSDALGRVYTVHPTNTECFHLRMLLFHVRGPTSFQDVKTYCGKTYDSFKEACNARGLLENDQQWIATMKDAVLTKNARNIRQMFAIILAYCQPSDPVSIYEAFKRDMAEDIVHNCQKHCDNIDFNDEVFNESLLLLNKTVQIITNGNKTVSDFGLPEPKNEHLNISIEYLREVTYDTSSLKKFIEINEPKLNNEQSTVYNIVLNDIVSEEKHVFYLDAPGGTGKTFLMNLLLAKVRSEGKIALAVASSGIAATLLHNGRTVHSTFKVPINLSECSSCNISKNSALAKLIENCALIIWDECSMSHKHVFEAINTTIKDIRNNSTLMGGITVLLAGDYRQTLPVIQRGTRADFVNASLKCSELWQNVKLLPPLQTNMRLSQSSQQYATILLEIGNGSCSNNNGRINITQFANLILSKEELINHVWPNINNIVGEQLQFMSERAILTPLNSVADSLNETILNDVDGEEYIYDSIDGIINNEDCVNYPIEFLNSLSLPGLPPHKLKLKIGVPIMLLRNIQPPQLCNGTRLIITRLMLNVIEAKILTGHSAGQTVLLPRIPLTSSDLPFTFKRLQFPIKLCFALTINKSQGQTFKTVGVDLTTECFSHGQLYVAASRVSEAQRLYVYSNDITTHNIVYPEVL